jgi:tetratricopeptide (TPR) repeat protein
MIGIAIAAAIIALPALAFVLWPLVRGSDTPGLLPVPPDPREQIYEGKRAALRALRELEFEHGAGHVSDDDYADLRARYEREAAALISELDRLGATPSNVARPASSRARATNAPARRSAWLHPAALAIWGVLVLVFGIAIGVGIVRYTAPDQNAGMPPPGSRPLADLSPAPDVPAAPGASIVGGQSGPARAIPPEVMKRMLEAARQALFAGDYGDAIKAYQAVLKRDPKNVDAMTHLGLIVAIGGHADTALETFDKALALDPNYAPALLYRGQVLYEAKKDVPGAIRSWEKFIAIAPPGEDRDRVAQMIAQAKRDAPKVQP